MPTDLENAVTPGLWRRLAAIFYDSWLVLALWLLGATADYFIQAAIGLGDAPVHLPLQLYLVACPFLFFGWFWTHGGQTLGMRSWRLKVLDCHGQPVGWRQALIRVAAAWLAALPLGLGYLWMLVDKAGLTWHDRLSRTRLVLVNKT
ncbi:MAG: RDD family protein [Gammaproteobacteria bacterium]|nr:RDD family protein [Gammaproteobacteria bacterium]MCP5316410.1 RDD family protein [Chromatiaceae bacterium]MCW5586831.1 RDD family protein [Chromatiales bacterium]MCB1819377.1 RDD family protein [Gammaproteobacteria bacterium]MCP5434282.1 RDD family protein [Chromatiaceae bacterium]